GTVLCACAVSSAHGPPASREGLPVSVLVADGGRGGAVDLGGAAVVRRAGGAGVRASSGPLAARKPVILWEPSQNGFCAERPHRHSATVPLPGEMRSPSWVTSSNGPRINSGPSS